MNQQTDIFSIIDYLNNSNKLPNLNKEIRVEFPSFSKEEIKQVKCFLKHDV